MILFFLFSTFTQKIQSSCKLHHPVVRFLLLKAIQSLWKSPFSTSSLAIQIPSSTFLRKPSQYKASNIWLRFPNSSHFFSLPYTCLSLSSFNHFIRSSRQTGKGRDLAPTALIRSTCCSSEMSLSGARKAVPTPAASQGFMWATPWKSTNLSLMVWQRLNNSKCPSSHHCLWRCGFLSETLF